MFMLRDAFPDLANELERLFLQEGEHNLAAQVSLLEIRDRCRCGDDFCATMYCQPRPKGVAGRVGRTVPLTNGLIVDVVGENIAEIEVLYSDSIRSRLNELMPLD